MKLIVNFVFSGLNGIFALWSEIKFSWGPMQIGIMMSFVGILLAFHQAFTINYIVRILKEKKTIWLSILSIFLGILSLTMSTNYIILGVGIFFCTMGIGIINPTINENSINIIKFNAKILGYKKILDLRSYGKKILDFERTKLFVKLFNQKKFKL